MRNLKIHVMGAVAIAMMACGSTAPKSASGQQDLEAQADATLRVMVAKDPSLDAMLRSSAGYVVFPEIGKGGFIAGAAHGRGVLYENGRHAGFVELSQGSFGAQVGAQSFSELIVFAHPMEVDRLKGGDWSMGAGASAVALTAGAGAGADFTDGVAVFIEPKGGAMVDVSVNGQKLQFSPGGHATAKR
jgi:lipid-binding SYLF domain-containing protein